MVSQDERFNKLAGRIEEVEHVDFVVLVPVEHRVAVSVCGRSGEVTVTIMAQGVKT